MVIQRIQSVFLLLAAACIGVYSFMPFAHTDTAQFTACDALPMLIVAILTILMLLINIFLYKDLRKQIRVAAINSILVIATMATAATCAITSLNATLNYAWLALPIAALILTLRARRAMIADRNLLSSADRIR
ncbi:MAG: DUF4293 family protein [Muribaculaceae bacterium]